MPSKSFTALSISLTLASCNVQPKAEVAAYGDSVTWGYGDLPGGWVRRVEQGSGYAISNLGIPGETSDEGEKRIDQALRTAPAAKTVFLLHGGNDWVGIFADCQRSCPPATVDERYEGVAHHLRVMRKLVVEAGKEVVFLSYWASSAEKCNKYSPDEFVVFQEHRRYLNTKIEAVAAENGDLFIPLGDLENFGAAGDFFDCLHPSAQGYKKIAGKILEFAGDWAPPDPSPRDLWDGPWRL